MNENEDMLKKIDNEYDAADAVHLLGPYDAVKRDPLHSIVDEYDCNGKS
jgi:hypothetical protein